MKKLCYIQNNSEVTIEIDTIILNKTLIVDKNNIDNIILNKYKLFKLYKSGDIIFIFDSEMVNYSDFVCIIDGCLKKKYSDG